MPFNENLPQDTILVSDLPSAIRELKAYIKNALEAEHYFADETNQKFGKHKTINADAVVTPSVSPPSGTDAVTVPKLNVQTDIEAGGVVKAAGKVLTQLIEPITPTEPVRIDNLQSQTVQAQEIQASGNIQANNLQATEKVDAVTVQATSVNANQADVGTLTVTTINGRPYNPLNINAEEIVTKQMVLDQRLRSPAVLTDSLFALNGNIVMLHNDLIMPGNKIEAREINALQVLQNGEPVMVPGYLRFKKVSNLDVINLNLDTEQLILTLDTVDFAEINDIVIFNAAALVWMNLQPSMTPASFALELYLRVNDLSLVTTDYQVLTVLQHSTGVISYPIMLQATRIAKIDHEFTQLRLSVRVTRLVLATNPPSPFIPAGWARIEVFNLR